MYPCVIPDGWLRPNNWASLFAPWRPVTPRDAPLSWRNPTQRICDIETFFCGKCGNQEPYEPQDLVEKAPSPSRQEPDVSHTTLYETKFWLELIWSMGKWQKHSFCDSESVGLVHSLIQLTSGCGSRTAQHNCDRTIKGKTYSYNYVPIRTYDVNDQVLYNHYISIPTCGGNKKWLCPIKKKKLNCTRFLLSLPKKIAG